MPGDTTVDELQNVEDLQKELATARTRYEKLSQAHEKLKGDLGELKELQSQVATLTADNSRIIKERDTASTAFEAYKQDIQQKNVKATLTAKLEEAGVRSTATTLKILDTSKLKYSPQGEVLPETIDEAISELRTSDPELFKSPDAPVTPPVKHAVDRVTKGAYETEMAAAVKAGDQKLVGEIYEKYHRS